MDDIKYRSLIYFWWRKSEVNNNIIKFGDHVEKLDNKNWLKNTEKYIQKTAAPREKNTWKELIEYQIFDVTEYAKNVNRNKPWSKIDNYLSRKVDFEKYRLGQTDQFKLPKFVYFDDFIDAIKTECFGNSTRDLSLPLSIDFTFSDLDDLKLNKKKVFDVPIENIELDAMIIARFFNTEKILIQTFNPDKYEEIINTYSAFNNFIIYKDNKKDGPWKMLYKKKVMICKEQISDIEEYDIIISDFKKLEIQIK